MLTLNLYRNLRVVRQYLDLHNFLVKIEEKHAKNVTFTVIKSQSFWDIAVI